MSASYTLWSPSTQPSDRSSDLSSPEGLMPPPKPPRGRLRQPVSVHRDPLQDNTNSPVPSMRSSGPTKSQYAGTDARTNLIREFFDRVGHNYEFTGREGLEAMMLSVQQRGEFKYTNEEAQANALKMLNHWITERVFRNIDDDESEGGYEYDDSKSSIYIGNPPVLHRVVLMQPSRSPSRDRSVRRRPSFKALFMRNSPKPRDRSVTPSRSGRAPEVGINFADSPGPVELPRGTPRISRPSTPARVSPVDVQLAADDAELFEAALKCLLHLVDISMLDDVLSKDFSNKEGTVSFLTSLIKRFVFSHEQFPTRCSSLVEELLENGQMKTHKDQILNWFECGSAAATGLSLHRDLTISPQSQVHRWALKTLQAVTETYSKASSEGKYPLIPMEFTQFLRAIAHQLCTDPSRSTRRDLAVRCIWWMLPHRVRRQLGSAINFITASLSTDCCFSFNEPLFNPHHACPENGDNFRVVADWMRRYILPKDLMPVEQGTILETLVYLTVKNELDEAPQEIQLELAALRQNNVAAVTFCHVDPFLPADQWYVEMITAVVEDQKGAYTTQRKQEIINAAKLQKPEIMAKYFPQF